MTYRVKKVLWLIPPIILILIYLVPISMSVVRVIGYSKFGLGNQLSSVLLNDAFILSIRNLLVFYATSFIILNVLGFFIADALFEKSMKYFKWLLVLLLPMIVPVASVAYIWQKIVLEGLGSIAISKTISETLALYLLFVWRNIGLFILIHYICFSNIDSSVIEAAKIDGAEKKHIMRNIILPESMSYLFIGGIVLIIQVFRSYREVYLIYGAYPESAFYMLQHYLNNLYLSFSEDKLNIIVVSIFMLYLIIVLMIKIWINKVNYYDAK